jgi:hypothetical protein
MVRTLDKHLWIVLLAIAVAVTVACSSSSPPAENDSGAMGAADTATGG